MSSREWNARTFIHPASSRSCHLSEALKAGDHALNIGPWRSNQDGIIAVIFQSGCFPSPPRWMQRGCFFDSQWETPKVKHPAMRVVPKTRPLGTLRWSTGASRNSGPLLWCLFLYRFLRRIRLAGSAVRRCHSLCIHLLVWWPYFSARSKKSC